MNCFEWQSRSSDFLDGMLIGQAKREAEAHLENCTECHDRHKHYRILLTSIANQPRSPLPIPLRKAPFTAVLPRADDPQPERSRWQRIPWYIRTSIEGTTIVFLILLGISAGPRLKALYERNIEKSMNEFGETFTDPVTELALNGDPSQIPLLRKKEAGPTAPGSAPHDDYAGENEDDETPDVPEPINDDSEIHVGNSEIWRFNLKTDSPHEIRPKIVQILTDLKIPTSTPGLGGIEAPGGIQFDLLVPKHVVPAVKRLIQKIAPKAPDGLGNSPMGETFAWYKNKSRRKLPNGQARIVIWLSQM